MYATTEDAERRLLDGQGSAQWSVVLAAIFALGGVVLLGLWLRRLAIRSQMLLVDIADAHRTSMAEKEFLTAMLESLQDGIVACDAEGELTVFNGATQRLHGLPAEAVALDRWASHFDLFCADGITAMRTDQVPLVRAFAGSAWTRSSW